MIQHSEYEAKLRNAHDKNFLSNSPSMFQELYFCTREFTMLSRERLFDLYLSVKYAIANKIEGDIVEVGCWGGGAVAVALSTLNNSAQNENNLIRTVWGFDTFEGHPEPNADEVDVWGNNQLKLFKEFEIRGENWRKSSFDDATQNIRSICDNVDNLRLIKGRAEFTVPQSQISKVSILRIYVDWYEPTLISLQHLYPKVSPGGVVIVDDYGHHSGSRRAVDEFFGSTHPKYTHIDYSCISFVKV